MAGSTGGDAPKEKTVKAVQYTGVAATATISKADWAKAGVEHDKVEWTKGSHIPESDLSKEALEVLGRDGRFKSVDVPAAEVKA